MQFAEVGVEVMKVCGKKGGIKGFPFCCIIASDFFFICKKIDCELKIESDYGRVDYR